MKWKEVYNKCNNSEYSQLVDIKEPIKLEANHKKFFEIYKIPIILFLILIVVLLFKTYKSNAKAFLACIAVLIIAFIFMIYYNSYKLTVKNNKLTIRIQLNDIIINCDDLVTLFLSKKKVFLYIFIPINIYYINIVYKKKKQLNIITLPTTMNKKEDVYKFFKHFKFEPIEIEK